MNKTAMLIGGMIVFVVANVLILSFALKSSQQPGVPDGTQQLVDEAVEAATTGSGGGAVAAADPAAFKAAMDIGQTGFITCAACHGMDGKGMQVGPLLMAPSLVGSEIALGDPDRAALVVLKGIKKETDQYAGLMAALPIDDTQLAGVLTYVRNSFGNSGEMVSPQQVAAARTRFANIPMLVGRAEIDSLIASTPKVEVASAVASVATIPGAAPVATSLPPVVEEPWVPIPGILVVGGRVPDQRPADAPPDLTSVNHNSNWYRHATYGISGPLPKSLEFLEDQGGWYTPFNRPGMTGPYDIRSWHIDD